MCGVVAERREPEARPRGRAEAHRAELSRPQEMLILNSLRRGTDVGKQWTDMSG